ncbi:MAG: carboxypeptidase-like regulatory domain-containing protein [Bacteroidota bacterium]
MPRYLCWFWLTLVLPILANAQGDDGISVFCPQCSLAEVLDDLEARYQLAFAYESSLVTDETVSVSLKSASLRHTLSKLFQGTRIEYELVSDRYILLRKRKTSLPPTITLCGQVIDSLTGDPLSWANIQVVGTDQGTQSDDAGEFLLTGQWSTTQSIKVSYLGYKAYTTPIRLQLPPHCGKIILAPDVQTMPMAIVKEFTVDMLESKLEENKITFQPERIPTLPGWGEPDLLRSLQLLPGISSPDGSASNLNIRGGSSDQNLLLWDDIPIYQSGHFFGQYSAFNPYLVKSADVYRGGFGPEYGGRLSGVIDIKSKPIVSSEPRFGLGLNLISAHAFAEVPIAKNESTLLFGARRSTQTSFVAQPIKSYLIPSFKKVVFLPSKKMPMMKEVK